MYKSGQLVTVENKVYKLTKAKLPDQLCTFECDCRTCWEANKYCTNTKLRLKRI